MATPPSGFPEQSGSDVWTAASAECRGVDRIFPPQMIENGLRPRQIVTRQARQDAAVIVGPAGGSTHAGSPKI
jgi:dihydroxyacid dehydratase/phosphogluconate dehydratase